MPAGDKGRPFKKIMKFIDWFAGIGGFRCGMELEGHECVGFCEYDKFAVASYISMHLLTDGQREYLQTLSLRQRQKEILKEEYKNGEWYANDVSGVDARSIPTSDCWCFGAPCQDFSVAGKRAGLDGDRSSLIREVFRNLWEIEEESRPEWLIYENVKGMFSSNRGFDYLEILLAMDELGYDCEWQLFNSKDWGVPQNRERVYTIGHLRRRGEQKIFPITGADGENSIQQIGNFMKTVKRGNPNQGRIYDTSGIAPCLNKMDGGGREPHVAVVCNTNPSGYGMNGNVFDSKGLSPTLTTNKGEGYKIIVQDDILLSGNNYNQRKVVHSVNGISRTLISGGHSGNEPKVAILVLTPDRIEKRQNGRRFKENGEPMFTLTSQDRHGVAVGVALRSRTEGQRCETRTDELSNALTSNTEHSLVGHLFPYTQNEGKGIHVQISESVTVYAIWYEKYQCYVVIRKLTPLECFRLQGWTDDYFLKAQEVNSDSQLYKQAGNGVTVTVIQAIAKAFSQLN